MINLDTRVYLFIFVTFSYLIGITFTAAFIIFGLMFDSNARAECACSCSGGTISITEYCFKFPPHLQIGVACGM
jgi:hypothetical protein